MSDPKTVDRWLCKPGSIRNGIKTNNKKKTARLYEQIR